MDAPLNGQLVRLADNGNVILVVRDVIPVKSRSFLVSSDILTIASPVLASVIGAKVDDGHHVQGGRKKGSGKRPTFTLEDDNLEAMDFILSTLHCKESRIKDEYTALSIADIAVQAHKYDCNRALLPWIRLWCDPDRFPVDSARKVRDMGYGLLVACLFRSPKFTDMSAKYAKELPPDFAISWMNYKSMSRVPKIVRETLTSQIAAAQRKIRLEVLSKLTELHGNDVICGPPGRSRPAQYIEALSHLDIWPSLLPFETHSVNDLVSMIHRLPVVLNHACIEDELPYCLLRDEVEDLYLTVGTIRNDMEGVPLASALRADSESEDDSLDESTLLIGS